MPKVVELKPPPPEKCEFCGAAEHGAPFACPRIKRVTFHEEGDVTIAFNETPLVILANTQAQPPNHTTN